MNRAVSVPVLVQALAKSKNTLDPGTAQAAKQIVVVALQDRDEGVRGLTVHALSRFGTEDMIPALKTVSETDPAPEVQGQSIRKSAAQAVAAIQRRVSQH